MQEQLNINDISSPSNENPTINDNNTQSLYIFLSKQTMLRIMQKIGVKVLNQHQTILKYETVKVSEKLDYCVQKVSFGYVECLLNVYMLPVQQYYIHDCNNNSTIGGKVKGWSYQMFATHSQLINITYLRAFLNKIVKLIFQQIVIMTDYHNNNNTNKNNNIENISQFDLILDKGILNAIIPTAILNLSNILNSPLLQKINLNHLQSQQKTKQKLLNIIKIILGDILIFMNQLKLAKFISFYIVDKYRDKNIQQNFKEYDDMYIYVGLVDCFHCQELDMVQACLNPYSYIFQIYEIYIEQLLAIKGYEYLPQQNIIEIQQAQTLNIIADFYINSNYNACLKLFTNSKPSIFQNKSFITNILTTLYFSLKFDKYLQIRDIIINNINTNIKISLQNNKSIQQNKTNLMINDQVMKQKMDYPTTITKQKIKLQEQEQEFEQDQRQSQSYGSQASNKEMRQISRKEEQFQQQKDVYVNNLYTNNQNKQIKQNKNTQFMLGQQNQYLLINKKIKKLGNNTNYLQNKNQQVKKSIKQLLLIGQKSHGQNNYLYLCIKSTLPSFIHKSQEQKQLFQHQILSKIANYTCIQSMKQIIKFITYYKTCQTLILSSSILTIEQFNKFMYQVINKCIKYVEKNIQNIHELCKKYEGDCTIYLQNMNKCYQLLISAVFMINRFNYYNQQFLVKLNKIKQKLEQIHKNISITNLFDRINIKLQFIILTNELLKIKYSILCFYSMKNPKQNIKQICDILVMNTQYKKILQTQIKNNKNKQILVFYPITNSILTVYITKSKLMLSYYTSFQLYNSIIDQYSLLEMYTVQNNLYSYAFIILYLKNCQNLEEIKNIYRCSLVIVNQFINELLEETNFYRIKHNLSIFNTLIFQKSTVGCLCRLSSLYKDNFFISSRRDFQIMKTYINYFNLPKFLTYFLQIQRNCALNKKQKCLHEDFQNLLDSFALFCNNLQNNYKISDQMSCNHVLAYLINISFHSSQFFQYRNEIQQIIINLMNFNNKNFQSQGYALTSIIIKYLNKFKKYEQISELVFQYVDTIVNQIDLQISQINERILLSTNKTNEIAQRVYMIKNKVEYKQLDSYLQFAKLIQKNDNESHIVFLILRLIIQIRYLNSLNLNIFLIEKSNQNLMKYVNKLYYVFKKSDLNLCISQAKQINLYYKIQQNINQPTQILKQQDISQLLLTKPNQKIQQQKYYNIKSQSVYGLLSILDQLMCRNDKKWVQIWEKAYLSFIQKGKYAFIYLNVYVQHLDKQYINKLLNQNVVKSWSSLFIAVQVLKKCEQQKNIDKNWQLLIQICNILFKMKKDVEKYKKIFFSSILQSNLRYVTAKLLQKRKKYEKSKFHYHKYIQVQKFDNLLTFKMIPSINIYHKIHKLYKKSEILNLNLNQNLNVNVNMNQCIKNKKNIYTSICSLCSYRNHGQVYPDRVHYFLVRKAKRIQQSLKLDQINKI